MSYIASIYIASSGRNIDAVRALGERLKDVGCLIEHEWWLDFDEAKNRGWNTDAEVEDEFAQGCAGRDLAAVARCESVVFLDSEHKSFGAALEIGYAWALGKPILVLGEPQGRIWERMDEWVRVADEKELIAMLRAVHAMPRRVTTVWL